MRGRPRQSCGAPSAHSLDLQLVYVATERGQGGENFYRLRGADGWGGSATATPTWAGLLKVAKRPQAEAKNAAMTAFVLEQMDYIFFVHGLSFFLICAICFYIASNRNAPPGWQWLGAFGALHGAKQWLHLGALSLGDDVYCQWLRLGILLLSFLCLCEFAERAAKGVPRFLRRRWLYPPLLVVSVSEA